MTAQFFQTELSTLIQESKRKNSDIKHAAEQELTELKALPLTSEAQLTADLTRRPQFAKPFILACKSRHSKLSLIGATCIQRLVAIQALPYGLLQEVLQALSEITSLGVDVQLKVLQALPSLFQFYSDDLNGELLAATFEICSALQNSKTTAISNTAAATLQQLVVAIFEKISRMDDAEKGAVMLDITLDGQKITVTSASYDGLRVIQDLCRLLEDQETEFLNVKGLPKLFVMELLESILTDNRRIFISHPEQRQVIQARLMPIIVRYMSEKHGFALCVRAARVLLIILKDYMAVLTADCEMALGLLVHLLEPDSAMPWKRVLCMEMFRGLYTEPKTVRQIFQLYDEKDGQRNIMGDHMASMVRLASERPSIIGVGHQSTLPTAAVSARDTMTEQVTLETGVAGVIGSGTGQLNACGISHQFSLVRIPLLEMLDKQDPPTIPETYIYSLVLNCIGAFADSLAKFILPLTVPDSKNKKRLKPKAAETTDGGDSASDAKNAQARSERLRMPLNPLDLESHPNLADIQTCAKIIDECWPALLATCSTYLYAALDNGFYHNLVRSYQKFAHVAGLLRLTTPRDSFLTTLEKAAIPAGIFNNALTPRRSSAAESLKLPNAVDPSATSSDAPSSAFSTRNLLCLRALLNLGIALGPTLSQDAWFIIIETLWYADLMVGISTKSTAKLSDRKSIDLEKASVAEASRGAFGNEILAVQTAATKMFEATKDYPNIAFRNVLVALLGLSDYTKPDLITLQPPALSPEQAVQERPVHQTKRSISVPFSNARVKVEELRFVLEKVTDLSNANVVRLSSPNDTTGNWKILSECLVAITGNEGVDQALRSRAGNVLDNLVFASFKLGSSADEQSRNEIQLRGLKALKDQISGLWSPGRQMETSALKSAAFDVHGMALETLRAVLEECGDALVAGWDLVFDLISSVFYRENEGESPPRGFAIQQHSRPLARSPKLIRTAHNCLQLLSSDFLAALPSLCLLDLIVALSDFASQTEDFNISLTSTTSFWNLSDFLRSQIESFSIEHYVNEATGEEELVRLAKDTDIAASRNALWMLLLMRMVDLSTDSRSEIRNSALQTVLRIVDAYGQHLSPPAWGLCLNKVLFVMAEAVNAKLTATVDASSQNSSKQDDKRAVIETAVLEVKGLSGIFADHFSIIVRDTGFGASWERLLGIYKSMVKTELLEIHEAVYASFKLVLSRIGDLKDVSSELLHIAWSLWDEGHPVSTAKNLDIEAPNQDALAAYLEAFREIYRLLKEQMSDEQVSVTLEHFRTAIWGSVLSRYSSDIDHLSEVQRLVVDYLKMLCMDRKSSQQALLICLSDFSDCALTKGSLGQEKRLPSFVSFSKTVTNLLPWYFRETGIVTDLLDGGELSTALNHLASLIKSKYNFPGVDKEPSLWKVATTASLDILEIFIPWVEGHYGNAKLESVSGFWQSVVNVLRGIVSASIESRTSLSEATIFADEQFDLTAFSRLKTQIVPSLGSPYIPDDVRRSAIFVMLSSSFTYPPQASELSDRMLAHPLAGLYQVRMGRTHTPRPNPRLKLAYALLDTLFELSSTYTGSAEAAPYVKLAEATLPYLILRVAISLKTYIADQPLRGLMPQPTPSQKELLYLVDRSTRLESEPSAIPGPSTIAPASSNGSTKKHLAWLRPLVLRGIDVAGKESDGCEVLVNLTKLLKTLDEDTRSFTKEPNALWATSLPSEGMATLTSPGTLNV